VPTAGSVRSRGKSLRTRILAIALIPSLSLMLVGLGAAVYTGYRGYEATTESGKYANLDGNTRDNADSAAVRDFVQALRDERRMSGELLGDPAVAPTALQAQWERTDRAAARVKTITPPVVTAASLEGLTALRPKIQARQVSLVDGVDRYSAVIVDVDGRRSTNLAAAVADPLVVRQDEIDKQLADLTETLDRSDALAFSAFADTGMPTDALQSYSREIGDFLSLLTTLQQALPPAEAGELNSLTAGPDGEVVAVVQRSILRSSVLMPVAADAPPKPAKGNHGTGGTAGGTGGTTGQGTLPTDAGTRIDGGRVQVTLPVPRPDWRASTARVTTGLVGLQRKHLEYAAGIARDVGTQQLSTALIGSVVLLVFAVLVLVISLGVSRGLIGRLRRLRQETIELSNIRLPQIVSRLRAGEQVDVGTELPALDYGSDEIGQVADAFSEAQRTAVSAAALEAETRSGLRKVFLDIAHRSQAIVYRQLKVLDKAERSQEDPDQLELLFQLDHLATRARRNAENLIILGGGQAGRQWRGTVPLRQLIRSAVSEAENYARVTVSAVPDVAISGSAAADLIHLLAELVDNATSFSPPASDVEVRGNVVGRGLVIEIEDRGLGIQADQLGQLNEMLHNPPDFQMMALATEPRLGLFVVARLAAKHGIRVTLTASLAYGGTMVVVLVPSQLLLGDSQQGALPELSAPPRQAALEESSGPVPGYRSTGPIPVAPVPTGPMAIPSHLTPVPTGPRAMGPRAVGPAASREPAQSPQSAPPRPQHAPSGRRAAATTPFEPGGLYGVPAQEPSYGSDRSEPPPPAYAPQEPVFGSELTPMRRPDPVSMQRPDQQPPMLQRPEPRGGMQPGQPLPQRREQPTQRPEQPIQRPEPRPAYRPDPRPGGFRPDLNPGYRPEDADRYRTDPTPTPTHRSAQPPAQGPVPSEAPGGARPELPRRQRLAHMSPKLMHTPDVVADAPRPRASAPMDAETARSRMSALQRGTIRGRAAEPEEPR